MEENKYLNYQNMVSTVTTGMAQLENVCKRISMDSRSQELKEMETRLKEHIFSVGIMGEFRRGKSTVINALLGKEIVPADIVPCSATLNYVRWDVNKHAEIRFKNGEVKEVAVEELSNYVTKITKESEAMAANVEDATVFYPCRFCQNGVQIVDTPGLNDDERMTAITENVIPKLDAIIMVLVPDSPFSQSEAEFVRNKLMASDLGKLIFIVNKIDMIDEDDRPRLLRSIKEKIESSVLEKTAAVYGKDSDEYIRAKGKIGDIKILPVSARKALKAKLKDSELPEESGYAEFESVLSRMLTEERGTLELLHPVNRILSVSKSAVETLETRLEALNIDAEEFEKIQLEAIEKINNARAKKKEEIEGLKAKGKTLFADLIPEVGEIYTDAENVLTEYAENYPINSSDLSSEASLQSLSEAISKNIDKQLEETLSIHAERLICKVKERLGKDMESLNSFSIELEEGLDDIRGSISAKAGGGLASLGKNIIFDVGGMYATLAIFGANIPGVGGLISGFREHGIKGAIAGGLSGAVIGFGAAMLCASVGIFGLPFALIAGTASTFGGKAVTNLIFGKKNKAEKKINELRESLTASVKDMIGKLRQSSTMEKWLKETCETAYSQIAEDVDKEWETSLRTMEDTLTQIKIDIEMNASNKEKAQNDMKELQDEIMSVLNDIKPIKEKLSSAANEGE